MHLLRVRVPDFRVLKDVDIKFEKEFMPRVFPLGSENGGGKSTLLQLIFVLLHCSTNSERLPYLKNFLSGFTIPEGTDKRILAILNIWDGDKSVELEFFASQDTCLLHYCKLGDAKFDLGKKEEAINDYSEAIRLKPDYVEAYYKRGDAKFDLGKKEEASDDYNKAIQLKPDYVEVYCKRGNLQLSLGKKQEAIDDYNKAIQLKPDYAEVYCKRGNLQLSLGKKQEAIDDYNKAIQLKPDYVEAYFKLNEAKGNKQGNDYKKAHEIDRQTRKKIEAEGTSIREKASEVIKQIDRLMPSLRLSNSDYITIYGKSEKEVLLCHVKKLFIPDLRQFLHELSNKVFLAAPSTQVFLFIPQSDRKSLFMIQNNGSTDLYQSSLRESKSNLLGLFTYDFLAVNYLNELFKSARDKDFKDAVETGEYGNNYKKLLNELNSLMINKSAYLKPSLDDLSRPSGVSFKENESPGSVELYPEDLSHGELKRLSIYCWLKYKNIENAIVLMDEVDIALHPDWQYRIVDDLMEWAPSNQYILATHSYNLCEALTPSHVKILEPRLPERRSN